MTTLKIMNLSNGAILWLENVSVEKMNLKVDLSWDSNDVIGRMNGIKNYKNTTKTRNIEIKTASTSETKTYFPEDTNSAPKNINQMKQNLQNPQDFQQKNLETFLNSGEIFERFFYPSYIESSNTINGRQKASYFMQSAPMFYISLKEENLDYTSYCIIKSFDFNVIGSDFGQGKSIDTFSLSFQIEEIQIDIKQVSSIIRFK